MSSGRKPFTQTLGIVAAVAFILFAYQELSPPRGAGLLKAAAQDHQREVVDVIGDTWLRDRAAISGLMEGDGLTVPSLVSLAPVGYHLDRAKRCLLSGVSFVHLVFTNGSKEFSVYLGAPVPRAKLAKEGENHGGIYAADFEAGHVACLETKHLTAIVVGNGSPDSVLALTRLVQSSL